MQTFSEGPLVFNGINAITGDYGQPPLSSPQLARLIQGAPSPNDYREFVERQKQLAVLARVDDRLTRVTEAQLGLREAEMRVRLEELRLKARGRAPWPQAWGGRSGARGGGGVGGHFSG